MENTAGTQFINDKCASECQRDKTTFMQPDSFKIYLIIQYNSLKMFLFCTKH